MKRKEHSTSREILDHWHYSIKLAFGFPESRGDTYCPAAGNRLFHLGFLQCLLRSVWSLCNTAAGEIKEILLAIMLIGAASLYAGLFQVL